MNLQKIAILWYLVDAYYEQAGNSTGGCLHICLDDQNLRDSDITFCIEWAKKSEDLLGEMIGNLLLEFKDEDERISILTERWKYLDQVDEVYRKIQVNRSQTIKEM